MPKTQVKEEDLIKILRTMQGGNTALGQEAPRPSAQDNLGTFQAMRAERPVQSPVDPGTHTQARRQADEQARQYQSSLAEQQRQFETSLAEQIRQFDAQQAQQMALAQMSMARGGTGGTAGGVSGGVAGAKTQLTGIIQGLVQEAAKTGRPFSDVTRYLDSLNIWDSGVMSYEEAEKLARRYYGNALGGNTFASEYYSPFSYTPGEAARRQSAMSAADLAQGMNIVPTTPGHGPTRADLAKFAQQDFHAGTPHEAIKPGTYRDHAGRLYRVDEWGKIIYEGEAGWGQQATPSSVW